MSYLFGSRITGFGGILIVPFLLALVIPFALIYQGIVYAWYTHPYLVITCIAEIVVWYLFLKPSPSMAEVALKHRHQDELDKLRMQEDTRHTPPPGMRR